MAYIHTRDHTQLWFNNLFTLHYCTQTLLVHNNFMFCWLSLFRLTVTNGNGTMRTPHSYTSNMTVQLHPCMSLNLQLYYAFASLFDLSATLFLARTTYNIVDLVSQNAPSLNLVTKQVFPTPLSCRRASERDYSCSNKCHELWRLHLANVSTTKHLPRQELFCLNSIPLTETS